jgi:short-subunit dehydrogenase
MELEGSRVLVTGASSGIGAAAAVAFAGAGATVGVCARRGDRLAEVLERCRAVASGSRSWTVDLADLDGLPAFAARADDELGGVDVLVNNAGVPMRRRMQDLALADLEAVMRINFYSPVVLTSALLPRMLQRGRGRIVNVSSMGTRMIAMGVGAYAASKAALELYTEGLYADLLGTGVSAQLFVPGSTNTEFSTPREGDRAPAFADPNAMEPGAVAAALVELVRTDDFEGHASDALARTARSKRSDPNAFLSGIAARLVPTTAAGE